jgi:hypothetical protein
MTTSPSSVRLRHRARAHPRTHAVVRPTHLYPPPSLLLRQAQRFRRAPVCAPPPPPCAWHKPCGAAALSGPLAGPGAVFPPAPPPPFRHRSGDPGAPCARINEPPAPTPGWVASRPACPLRPERTGQPAPHVQWTDRSENRRAHTQSEGRGRAQQLHAYLESTAAAVLASSIVRRPGRRSQDRGRAGGGARGAPTWHGAQRSPAWGRRRAA